MAKNTARKSTATASKSTERRTISPEMKAMENHFGEVTGGRKYDVGTKVEILGVYINRFGQDQARIMIDGETGYINPKFLKKGKPLPAARTAQIEAEREAANTPIMVYGRVVKETPGGEGKSGAVLLDYSGWFKPIWFSKEQVAVVHKFSTTDEDDEHFGKVIVEVPSWKVKASVGQDGLSMLESKQDGFLKLIPAKKAA